MADNSFLPRAMNKSFGSFSAEMPICFHSAELGHRDSLTFGRILKVQNILKFVRSTFSFDAGSQCMYAFGDCSYSLEPLMLKEKELIKT